MRPIYWGVIWFFIGMVGIAFSVIAGVITGVSEITGEGEVNPILMVFVYIFGILFFFSLPVAGIVELVLWAKTLEN